MAHQAQIPSRSLSGNVRLGILLTALWVIFYPAVYALAAHFNPPFLHDLFPWAYDWWETLPSPEDPYDLFTTFMPELRLGLLALLTFGIPAALWLGLLVLPRSLHWVADGYRNG